MTMTYTSAKNPKWASDDHSSINLIVKFNHLSDPVPFTARSDDSENHGRELFIRAVDGEFGQVSEYVAPTEMEIAQAKNPQLRSKLMSKSISQAQHWDMMGNPTKAAEWRTYYQQLFALESSSEWPIVSEWPKEPAE